MGSASCKTKRKERERDQVENDQHPKCYYPRSSRVHWEQSIHVHQQEFFVFGDSIELVRRHGEGELSRDNRLIDGTETFV